MELASKFEVIASEIGEMAKCGLCGAVMDQVEREGHKCPPSKDEVRLVSYIADLEATAKLISDETLPVKDRMVAIENYQRIQDWFLEEKVAQLEKHLTFTVLRGLLLKEMARRLENTRAMREREYQMNDERRMKGIPYVDRMKLFNKKKIAWCDEQEQYLLNLSKSFQVRPIKEWMTEAIYWSGKRKGIEFIIRFNFEEIISNHK